MTLEEKYGAKIDKALEPVLDELMHPEHYDQQIGHRLRFPDKPYFMGQQGHLPLRPRDRLGRRLTLLLVLKKLELDLMKEIHGDKEAAEDAKANPP